MTHSGANILSKHDLHDVDSVGVGVSVDALRCPWVQEGHDTSNMVVVIGSWAWRSS